MNYYSILGIRQGANLEEIKQAYRKLAKQYHPDLNPSLSAEQKFKEVQEAYEALSGSRAAQAKVFTQEIDPLEELFRTFAFSFGPNNFSYRQANRKARQANLTISFIGDVSEEDMIEIRRMLAARGCKVVGHSIQREY